MELNKQQEVKKIISEWTGWDMDVLEGSQNLRNELDVDSLDMVEMVMDCEKQFNIVVLDEEIAKVNTVDDFVELINELRERQDSKSEDRMEQQMNDFIEQSYNMTNGYPDESEQIYHAKKGFKAGWEAKGNYNKKIK